MEHALSGTISEVVNEVNMKNLDSSRRVAVTGIGVVSALGGALDSFWQACREGRSGLRENPAASPLPVATIAPAAEFTGKIQDFGPLDDVKKKAIRKGSKLMAREIQMGVAAAQLALQSAQTRDFYPSRRFGVSFASDYVVTTPQELTDAVAACRVSKEGVSSLDLNEWPLKGLTKMTPLWQLKYLTNMSASHITIYNALYGPAYDVTNREASFGAALAEAVETIKRGAADAMIVGATGTRLQSYRFVDAYKYGEISEEALRANGGKGVVPCRPFDARRCGSIPGEGAAALVIESVDSARERGATIYAEVLGGVYRASIRHASDLGGVGRSLASNRESLREAYATSLRAIVAKFGLRPEEIGHINAAARGDANLDAAEALALRDVFGDACDSIPVVSLSGHIGNPGAGCGAIQTVASILALENDELFPTLGYEEPDESFRVNVSREGGVKPGASFLKLCGNTLGQTSAVYLRKYVD